MAGLELNRSAQFLLGAGVMLASGAEGDVHDGGGFFKGEMNILSVSSAVVLTVVLLFVGAFVFKRLEPAVLKEI